MIITRIDSKRNKDNECYCIHLQIDGKDFVLSEELGKLLVHSSSGRLIIRPKVSNEIVVEIE